MQLLRRVADLRAHPELEAVGKPRRSVHVDASRVDAARKRIGRLVRGRHDRVRMPRAVRVDVRRSPRPPRRRCRSTASSRGTPSPSPPPSPRPSRLPEAPRARSSPTSSTPASASALATAGRNASATAPSTSKVSAALHTPGRCTFALTAIRAAISRSASACTYTWQTPAAAYMTGTVATSLSAAFNPPPPRGITRSTRPSAVARAASSSRSPESNSTAPFGQPRVHKRLADQRRKRAIRPLRIARAAQHDRVPRLQAERRAIDRHIRPRLIDHGHDTERHAHLLHLDPARKRPMLDLLANRIIESRHDLHALSHSLDPLGRKRQPIPKSLSQSSGTLIRQIRRIGLEHLTRPLPKQNSEPHQSGILDLGRGVASSAEAAFAPLRAS